MVRKLARDGVASKGQSLTRFLSCFKRPTNWLFISIELSEKVSCMPIAPSLIISLIVSFFLEKHFILECYR